MLAAATYLDRKFADAVIDELIADEHRAVVPSFFGMDLDPIMRHALNAKRIHVYRDAVLTVMLVLGLVIATRETICWLILGLYASVVARQWHELKAMGRLVAVVIGLVLGFLLLGVFAAGIGAASSSLALGTQPTGGGSTVGLIVKTFAYPIFVLLVLVGFEWSHYTRLADGFRWGATNKPPDVANDRIRHRVEDVSRAQYGNVTVYTGWSPFIGAGLVVRSWSIAVDLVSVNDLTNERIPVAIDPVDLHAAVLERVTALRDQEQPENERITGLATAHHIVAHGTRTADHALLDELQRPFSFAEPDTIRAIIRYPQGGIRYYQRLTVTADGKSIMDRFDREIAGAEDQEIAATSFIYLAVEGGMLYVEYVGTVMPPIREAFHVIDALPRTIRAEWLPKVLRAAAIAATDAILAPLRVIPGTLGGFLLTRRMDRATRDAGEYLVYDYGARASVRELGSAGRYTTYLQKLDWEKYSKFVERRMNEAVLDYLTAAGVDAADYRERVRIVQNNGVMITGDVSGQVAYKPQGAVTQTTTAKAAE